MKYLKIVSFISLLSVIFFAGFLVVLSKKTVPTKTPTQESIVVAPAPVASSTEPVVTKPASTTKPGTQVPTPTPAPVKPAPVVSNRCIVTIESQKYDVTDFRKIHSGGDIFVCGTDMTNTFFGQHNARLLLGTIMQGMKVQ